MPNSNLRYKILDEDELSKESNQVHLENNDNTMIAIGIGLIIIIIAILNVLKL